MVGGLGCFGGAFHIMLSLSPNDDARGHHGTDQSFHDSYARHPSNRALADNLPLTIKEEKCFPSVSRPLSTQQRKTVETSRVISDMTEVAKVTAGNVAPEAKPKSQPANHKKKIASDREYKGDDAHLIYKSGIPTLRSSAHRVKFDVKRRKHDPKPKDRDGNETNTTWLPPPLLSEDVFSYDTSKYNLRRAVISLLQSCDEAIVGTFEKSADSDEVRLEDFRVPVPSVWRSVNGGCCEDSQRYLSDAVASNTQFLELFDKFVEEVALPYLKRRLIEATGELEEAPVTFYYQRPPTMRLQPGPGWAKVKPHNDAEYGHQNGELNFWIPLTDRTKNDVDLWCESEFKADDYHRIPAEIGEAISFHGSSCRHYVNANGSPHSRVSLDFRIGVQGYFDPYWQMKGTTDDHGRREVTL